MTVNPYRKKELDATFIGRRDNTKAIDRTMFDEQRAQEVRELRVVDRDSRPSGDPDKDDLLSRVENPSDWNR